MSRLLSPNTMRLFVLTLISLLGGREGEGGRAGEGEGISMGTLIGMYLE